MVEDDAHDERETKMAGYAAAAVPFLWTVGQPDDLCAMPTLTAYRLGGGQCAEENVVKDAGLAIVTAAPVPITSRLTDLDL